MSTHYCQADHKEWAAAGLADEMELDRADYVNQEPDGFDQYKGEWFYEDESRWIIYWGTFGNDHSPGASHYTYAEVYDTVEEFKAALTEWEAKEEYLDTEEEEEEEEEEDPPRYCCDCIAILDPDYYGNRCEDCSAAKKQNPADPQPE